MIARTTGFFRALSLLLVGVSIFGIPSFAQNPVGRPAKPAPEHDWSMYDWSTSPVEELGQPGAKTVSLAACPPGVKGNEPEYWILLNGAEPAKVTGGTCAGDGRPGTLQFMSHGAFIPAEKKFRARRAGCRRLSSRRDSRPPIRPARAQSGRVMVPPGEYKTFARISIRASNLTVDFSGSIIECWMNDTCIFVGRPYECQRLSGHHGD